MSVDEARAALELAPADDEMSKVEPNMTRRDVVYLCQATLRSYNKYSIDVAPAFARKIAAVVQDWPDPVELKFAYQQDHPAEYAKIIVGWNKEELAVRKGEKPKYVPVKTLEQIQKRIEKEMEFRAQQERVAQIHQLLNAPPPNPVIAAMQAFQREAALGEIFPVPKKADPPPPPPEEPKPGDPKFVLKRPKQT